jgi:hypothetical protein
MHEGGASWYASNIVRFSLHWFAVAAPVACLASVLAMACSSSPNLCTTEVVPSELSGDLPIAAPPKSLEGTTATFCWRNECGEMRFNDPERKLGNYALVNGPSVRIAYSREGLADFKDGDPISFTLKVDAPAAGAPAKYELNGTASAVSVVDDGCRRYARGKIVPR